MKPVRGSILAMVAGLFAATSDADRASAQAGCTSTGTTMTCTGDQSGGIDLTNTAYETLQVRALMADIAVSGVPGIRFSTNTGGPLTLSADTGPYSIATNGNSAYGLHVSSIFLESSTPSVFAAGDVNVSSSGSITTTGNSAFGIRVDQQSTLSMPSQPSSLKGGNITLSSASSISTSGSRAHGIDVSGLVYSSLGQATPTQGGDVSVVTTGTIRTYGSDARGVNVSSRAGGSDSHGAGAVTSIGGDLSLHNDGSVYTRGSQSHGLAASLRLDASSDDSASSELGKLTVTSENIETFGDGAFGVFADYYLYSRNLGGENHSATEGVTVVNNGVISTYGTSASGLRVFTSLSVRDLDGYRATATLGDTLVENRGSIVTRGDGAAAIFLNTEMEVSSRDGTATFGTVTVNSEEIRTEGQSSDGIWINDVLAKSTASYRAFDVSVGARTVNANDVFVAGDNAAGIRVTHSLTAETTSPVRSADVIVNSTGTLSATGANSIGIVVDTLATTVNATNGDISINILGGSVTGGSGTGAGISLENGQTNTISNSGAISAVSGLAIRSGGGNEVVENRGTIIGDVLLGAGINAFNNYANGRFAAGVAVDLGAGNTLTNEGRFALGETGTTAATALTGSLVQRASGVYEVDVDFSTARSDRISISEGATLAGTVIGNAIGSGTAGLSQQFLILSAAGGVTDNGVDAVDTAAVDYSVIFDANGQDVYLGALIDFSTASLNRNQMSIASALNALQAGGHDASMSPMMAALLNLPTGADLARAYDQISPEVFAYQRLETLTAATEFSNTLMSCREAGGPNAAIREGECLWARSRATELDVDRTQENLVFTSRIGSFAAGLQVAMATDWRFGVAVGYDLVSLSTSDAASADGRRANVGAVVKYNPGPLLLAAGVSAGWGSFETDRRLQFGGFAETATSKSDTDYVTGWLRAAYLFDAGGWYLKPLVDARITEIDFDGTRETGAAGLELSGARDTVLSVSPALEIGREFRFDSISVWRPFVRAGVTWNDNDRFVTQAAFAGAAGGVPGFEIVTDVDDVLFDVSAGVDVIASEGAVLRAQYDASFGSSLSRNSVSLKGSVPF